MKKRSATKNAIWIIACKVVQALLGMVISMISARYLGPSNYGLISYAASVVAFAIPVMQLGFRSTLVQELVDHPDREGEIMGTALLFNVVSSLACMLGVLTFTHLSYPGEAQTLWVCGLYSVNLLFQATEMIQYWFQAKLLSQYTSLASLGAYLVVSAYKIYLLVTQKSVYWFAFSNAIDYLLISAALFVLYRKIGGQKLSVSVRRGWQMFSRSKHFIVSSLMVTVFAQTDRIMIKSMLGNVPLGYYSAAVTCASVTSFVFAAIIDSMRPVAFEDRKVSHEEFEKDVITCYSIVIWLSLLQSAAFFLFPKFIIHMLCGDAYLPATDALRIVVWYTTFSYLGPVRNIWLLAMGRQKCLWVVNFSGAAMNVLLNWMLIPRMGITGAATASLITQFFTNVVVGFIMPAIRPNNTLMLRSLHPGSLIHHAATICVQLRSRLRKSSGPDR